MEQIFEFVDERQKSLCIHCGGTLTTTGTNKDHTPSKNLLRKPYPDNLPVVSVCIECNSDFSRDEEYLFLFLKCVLAGSTNPSDQRDPKTRRALRRHDRLRARIERTKIEWRTKGGETRIVWKPETERVNRIIIKNARGHALYEYGEPMLTEPDHVHVTPLEALTVAQRDNFENIQGDAPIAAWPEVGSRMMTRVITGQDLTNGWVVVQDDVYRYGVAQNGGILVRSVLWDYLATEVFWSD